MSSIRQRLFVRLVATWERYWFQPVPPHSSALLRIAFGALGLINLIGLTPVDMFWSIDGLAPLPGGGLGLKTLLVDAGLSDAAGWVIFGGLFLAFACFTVGYQSAWAGAACFAGTLLQIYWNPLPLSSAQQVLVVILFCLVWTDSGACLSIDAWLARRRGTSRHPTDVEHPMWPLRLIRIQVALIYLNSGLWKLFGASWRDGTAIYYALNLNVFHRVPFMVPAAAEWTLTIATYVTLFWELAFVFMLFHRVSRRIALVIGVLLHMGVWATLEVGPFSWLMIASYIAFLDPQAVSRWVATYRRAAPGSNVKSVTGPPVLPSVDGTQPVTAS
jgi:hypothetical protein